jgi:alpha-1,6-mannosyltransferase
MINQAKTLHLTNAFHATSGGVATSYRALLKEADKSSRLMRLVVPSDRDDVEEVGRFGRIYHVAAPHSRLFDTRYRTILPQRYLIGTSGRIWEILAAEQPDLLEIRDKLCLNWLGGLFRQGWSRRVKRPVLVASSSERLDDLLAAYLTNSSPISKFARLYMRYCYIPLFDFHTANSAYTADEIHQAMTPRHARPVLVCPEGVDCERFSPERRDQAFRGKLLNSVGGNDESLLLLYSGRLSPEKNLGLLPRIMEKLWADGGQDYRLIVAGDGPLALQLRQQLEAAAPGRVVFLGHLLDRDQLARLYASCDIFIHPNPREPFGIAPLEAMASGLALVAPRSGGILSYADESCSWLVLPNAIAFAGAIRGATNRESRASRTQAARKVAERHSWPIVAEKLFRLFDHLVQGQLR